MINLLSRLVAATDANTGLPKVAANQKQVTVALQVLFGVLGAVALIYILIGAFNFVTSQGDPQGTTKARNTIIYAVIGLVIAVSAEAIVDFVLGKL